jgi:hypothetical protein
VFRDRTLGILLLHWSRQIGKSYTLAAWAVDRLLTQLQGYDRWLITVLPNRRTYFQPVESSSGTVSNSLVTNLVAYWTLNQTVGNDRLDSLGNYNLKERSSVGETNGILSYGAHNIGLSAELTNNFGTSLNPTDLSISFWYKTDLTGSLYFLLNGTNTTVGNFAFNISKTDSQLTFYNGASTRTFNSIMVTGQVLHVVFIYNSADTNTTLYTNGVLHSTSAAHTGAKPTISHTQFWVLGRNATGYLGGWMDELAIWSKMLSSSEVTNLYNNGAGLTYPF